jgi:hypothetical protein
MIPVIIYLIGVVVCYLIAKCINYKEYADDTVGTVVKRFLYSLTSWLPVLFIGIVVIWNWVGSWKVWNKRASKWL